MTVEQRAQVAAVFDRAADTYDGVGVAMFQPIAAGLVDALDPQPGERALDVGCGRGAVLFPLARAIGPTGRVVGVDLAPRMVASTAADAAAAGLDVEVLVDDAQDLAVTGPFDLVASSLVLFFLPDPVAALRSWRGVLAPDGRAGISTFGPYDERWQRLDQVLTRFQPPRALDPRTQGAASPFASDRGVEGLFTQAGFRDVRTSSWTIEVRFDSKEQWYDWTWSQGQRRMWESVPEERHAEVRAVAFEQLDQCRDRDGRLGFDQQVRYTLASA